MGAGGGEPPGDGGGDGAGAVEVAGLVGVTEEGLGADDELEGGPGWGVVVGPPRRWMRVSVMSWARPRGSPSLRASSAVVVEGGDDGGEVGGGQEGGELSHAVAEDAAGDAAAGPGAGVAGEPAGFVAAQDLAAYEVAQAGVAEAGQAAGHGGVDPRR